MEEENVVPGTRWTSQNATPTAPATPTVPKAGAIPPPSDPFRMWTVVLGVLLAVALIVAVVGLIMATGDSDSHSSSSYSSYSRYSDTTADDSTGAGWWVFSGGLGSVGALLPCLLLSMIGTQVWSIRAGVRPKGLAPVTV